MIPSFYLVHSDPHLNAGQVNNPARIDCYCANSWTLAIRLLPRDRIVFCVYVFNSSLNGLMSSSIDLNTLIANLLQTIIPRFFDVVELIFSRTPGSRRIPS